MNIMQSKNSGHKMPSSKIILSPTEIEGVRQSGKINTHLLDYISTKLYVGMTTLEINTLIHEETIRLGGSPATLDYNGYPMSLCTSINDQVCHGIPSEKVKLKEGDIINIDVSTEYKGYFSDSARVFTIGKVSKANARLVNIAKEAIYVGLKEVKPWTSMQNVGKVISQFANLNGYTVARGIGGHGIGKKFHEEPYVSYESHGTNMLMVPGMVFTIEPAINKGTANVFEDADNGWTIYTDDFAPSAQWEVTVLVTEEGYEILAK